VLAPARCRNGRGRGREWPEKLEKAEAGHSSGHQSSYESMAETFGEIIIRNVHVLFIILCFDGCVITVWINKIFK
jgi:hypothetical protein